MQRAVWCGERWHGIYCPSSPHFVLGTPAPASTGGGHDAADHDACGPECDFRKLHDSVFPESAAGDEAEARLVAIDEEGSRIWDALTEEQREAFRASRPFNGVRCVYCDGFAAPPCETRPDERQISLWCVAHLSACPASPWPAALAAAEERGVERVAQAAERGEIDGWSFSEVSARIRALSARGQGGDQAAAPASPEVLDER